MVILGFFSISLRTYFLSTDLLKNPEYNIPLEGKIIQIEILPSTEKRIILSLKDGRKVRLKIKGENHLEIGYRSLLL
jgi:hypothetical protein